MSPSTGSGLREEGEKKAEIRSQKADARKYGTGDFWMVG